MVNIFKRHKKTYLRPEDDKYFYYKKVFAYSLIIGTLIILPFMIYEYTKTGKMIFTYYGDYNVQQLPFYEHCVRMVRSGNIGWDWITDLGSSFIGSYSYYLLGSPFFWVMCLFPASWTPYLMGPMYIVKFVAAAVIAYAYLKRFVKNKDFAVIGALLYSFCGFQIYNIFFNQFQEVVALFPLLLIGIEEIVQNNRKGFFAVAVALNCMCNYFMFAGQVVFCLIYFFFRCLKKSFRIDAKKFGILAFESVLGVMMGAVLFLPAALAILGNYRLSYKFGSVVDMLLYMRSGNLYGTRYGHILQSLFFPPDIPSRVNFFYGHAARWSSNAAWIPAFGLSGVFAYLKSRKKSTLAWLVIVLIGFALVPILNSTFFLFNSNYYARWMYMLVMVAVVVTLTALEDTKVDFSFGLKVNTAIIVAITAYCGLRWFQDSENNDIWKLGGEPFVGRLWISVGIAILSMIALHFIIKRYRGTKVFTNILIVFVSIVTVAYSIVHITCGKSHSTDTTRIVNEAVEGELNLGDDEFYRIDFYKTPDSGMTASTSLVAENGSSYSTLKMTNVFDNLGISWETPSVECFHSVVSPSIMEFYEAIGVTRNVASRPTYDKYGLLGFLSVKYSFERYSLNSGKGTHPEDEYNGLSFTDLDDLNNPESELYDEAYAGIEGRQNNYDIYLNNYFISMGFYYDTFITESEFEDVSKSNRHILLCKYLVVPDDMAEYYSTFMKQAVKSDNLGENQVTRAAANYGTYVESVSERRECTCDTFEYTSSSFTATINMENPNVVMFTVPYEDGWTATVNGKKVDVLKVTYGFMGVECSGASDGNYVIEFSYSTPGLLYGLLITLTGIAILIVYLLYCRKKKIRANYKFFSEDYVECECPEYLTEAEDTPEESDASAPAGSEDEGEIEHSAIVTLPKAKNGLIASIIGFAFLGLPLGIFSIITCAKALKQINTEKKYTGKYLALAGILLSIANMIFVIICIFKLGWLSAVSPFLLIKI